MTRWIFRIIAIVMLLIFFVMFANLQRRLVDMQNNRGPAPARTR